MLSQALVVIESIAVASRDGMVVPRVIADAGDGAAYVEALAKDFEKPTVKQHLAAIRMLFDWLVTGQVGATNPAHSVRGSKHVVKTGKTTVLTGEQARELLDSIDASTVVGLRDRG